MIKKLRYVSALVLWAVTFNSCEKIAGVPDVNQPVVKLLRQVLKKILNRAVMYFTS
jgi:hypothetical protein